MFDEIPNVYNTIYEITTSTEGGQLSYSSIISNINGDTPMHTSWQSPDYGHSMGLVGYGNNEEICVNDTNIGDYRWLQKTYPLEIGFIIMGKPILGTTL